MIYFIALSCSEKNFTCHIITILPLPTPLHHRIVAIHQSFTSTALLIALFTSATSLQCFILFLGHLHLCILFIESTSLFIHFTCYHVTAATSLLPPLCSPICHRLVTCHRLVIIIFTFPSLPPLIVLSLHLYISFSVFKVK